MYAAEDEGIKITAVQTYYRNVEGTSFNGVLSMSKYTNQANTWMWAQPGTNFGMCNAIGVRLTANVLPGNYNIKLRFSASNDFSQLGSTTWRVVSGSSWLPEQPLAGVTIQNGDIVVDTQIIVTDAGESLFFSFPTANGYYDLAPTVSLQVVVEEFNREEELLSAIGSAINNMVDQLQAQHAEVLEEMQKQHEEEKGFLQKIVDTIVGLPKKIIDGFVDGLKSLFIPADNYFSDLFSDLNDFFSERLGILYEPFDFLIELLNTFLNSTGDIVLHIPEWKWDGQTVIPEMEYNLADNAILMYLVDFIHLVTTVLISLKLVGMVQDKFDEIVGGGL